MVETVEFKIAQGLLKYLGFLIAITMYQAGTAIMAQKRGDKSYLTQRMATLNPMPHIDLFGTVLFPLFTIMMSSPIVLGWPKMHVVDTRFFKKPRFDLNLVYLSGLGINFAIAFVCMMALRLLGGGSFVISPATDFSDLSILSKIMLAIVGLVNMTIGALFLLPLPGTAGWNLLINNVSYSVAKKLQEKIVLISIIGILAIVIGFLNFYFSFFIGLFVFGSNTLLGF